jgi:hypothetical protein
MMAFCGPAEVHDQRLKLLKQAAITGLPTRSKPRSHSRSTSSAAARPSTEDLRGVPLAVDITTIPDDEPDDDDETNGAGAGVPSSPDDASHHLGYFTQRAFVAQGSYRVGWVLDEERAACAACRRSFGALRRKHHCRGCGEVRVGDRSHSKTPLPLPRKRAVSVGFKATGSCFTSLLVLLFCVNAPSAPSTRVCRYFATFARRTGAACPTSTARVTASAANAPALCSGPCTARRRS